MNHAANSAHAVLAGIAIALLSGCATPVSPAPPWSSTVTTDPITGTKRCVVAAYDRVAGASYSRTGYLYPIIEFNSEFGLLVGVSSGGPIRFPVGDIVWRVDDRPYQELHMFNNPTHGSPPPGETAADMTSARIAETIKYAQKLAANAGATATVASGTEAAAMLDEMLAGGTLIYRANKPNAQFGLPTGHEQRVGQWTSDGLRPFPLDATFRQSVAQCRAAIDGKLGGDLPSKWRWV